MAFSGPQHAPSRGRAEPRTGVGQERKPVKIPGGKRGSRAEVTATSESPFFLPTGFFIHHQEKTRVFPAVVLGFSRLASSAWAFASRVLKVVFGAAAPGSADPHPHAASLSAGSVRFSEVCFVRGRCRLPRVPLASVRMLRLSLHVFPSHLTFCLDV